MRKGVITLTVAIALVSTSAMAMAPIIDPLPNPIVGNKSGTASQATAYVYPDAFDIRALSRDDFTTSDALKWSYELVGTQKYAINGVGPLAGTETNVAPPNNKNFNMTLNSMTNANDPNPDNLIQTITIRNIALYPYGGTPSTDKTAAAQNWSNNMQAITFWCSDGSLATSQTVMFYTDNTYDGAGAAIGYNRLSNYSAWTFMKGSNFATAAECWSQYDPFIDHTTSKTWSDGKGICFEVATTGSNFGSMASKMGFVTLVDNMVYRIRAKMNCSQATPGKTPFWDFILENWNGDAAQSMNLYGMDNFYLDNEGGANAVVSKALGTEVQMIWAPAAFQTNQWRNTTDGIYAVNPLPPAGNGKDYHLRKNAQLRFRVLDVDSNVALLNNQKSGSICLQSVILETCPVSRKVYTSGPNANPATAPIYEVIQPKAAHNKPVTEDPVKGNMQCSSLVGATIAYSTGTAGLQITPSTTGRSIDIVTVVPATDLNYTPGTWSTIADDWPIAWQSNKIYELAVTLSAPDATAAAHPWDVLWLNLEPPTNEVISESYVTATTGLAMPKQGTPQSYYMYYHSGNETKSGVAAYHSLRWRVRFGNSTANNWPDPADTLNTGMVRLHSVRVNTVDFR